MMFSLGLSYKYFALLHICTVGAFTLAQTCHGLAIFIYSAKLEDNVDFFFPFGVLYYYGYYDYY